MIRIGILGNIGSGKSYVAKNFGYPVFNADYEVSKLYKKDKKIFKKLKKKLPKYFQGLFSGVWKEQNFYPSTRSPLDPHIVRSKNFALQPLKHNLLKSMIEIIMHVSITLV